VPRGRYGDFAARAIAQRFSALTRLGHRDLVWQCQLSTVGLVANSTEKPLGLFPGKQSGGKLHVHGIVAAMAVDRRRIADPGV
jgi:hypothetical protein